MSKCAGPGPKPRPHNASESERKALVVIRVGEHSATLEVTTIVDGKATQRTKDLTQRELDALGEWLDGTQPGHGLEVVR